MRQERESDRRLLSEVRGMGWVRVVTLSHLRGGAQAQEFQRALDNCARENEEVNPPQKAVCVHYVH